MESQIPEEKVTMSGGEAGRWLLLAALIALGIVAYFLLASRTPPIVVPTAGTLR